MANYTCLNCRVGFAEADTQRAHYKTDWHRYNLKRKVAELPPVTAQEFQRRVQIVQIEEDDERDRRTQTYCSVCKKSFASDRSFQNHVKSKRHVDSYRTKNVNDESDVFQSSTRRRSLPRIRPESKTLVVEAASVTSDDDDDDEEEEEVDSDEWEEVISDDNPILRNDCLFCAHHSASLTKNLKHMSSVHSFFIPHVEYVTNTKGLLFYLGEKICRGYLCLWCNDRKNPFGSIEAVRSHMMDKGHAKIRSDTESSLEYLDFYDFEANYVDDDDDDDDEEEKAAPSTINKGREKADDEEAVTMLLPSGEVICHRSLLAYFRQNPNVAKNKSRSTTKNKVQKLINYYRDLGWNPTRKELAKKKAKDIAYINYVRAKYEMKLKAKANKLQRYYRPQVEF